MIFMIIFHLFSSSSLSCRNGDTQSPMVPLPIDGAGLSVVRLVATPRHAVALCEGGQLLEEAVVGPGSKGGSKGFLGSPKTWKNGRLLCISIFYIYI